MGREDDPEPDFGRALFLENRASGGMRVRSVAFPLLDRYFRPRVSRIVGALDADPEGTGRGGRRFDLRSATRGLVAWTRCV